jgi:putative ABC transport system permease protein
MERLAKDLRHGFRSLARRPGSTVVSILCMGLGIGVCLTLFALVNPWLFRPLPYTEPERIVGLRETRPMRGAEGPRDEPLSDPNFLDWQSESRSFSAMAAFDRTAFNISAVGEPEHVPAARVTATLFPLLGIAPALGRGFDPDEDVPRGPRVAILGHALWQRRFGAAPHAPGRTIVLDDEVYTVVGVMPPGFAFPEYAEVWTPLGIDPGAHREDRRLDAVARLAPGAAVEHAQAELSAIAAALERRHPDTNRERGVAVRPLLEWLTPPGVVAALRLLLAAGLLVQLIACANVANVLLARAASRRRETALCLALGAGRGWLLRQSLIEALLVSVAGAGLGLLLTSWGVEWLLGETPIRPPFWVVYDLDVRALLFVIAVAVGSAALVSLAPVLQAGSADLLETLKEGSRSVAGGPRGRVGRALVVSELGLSLVLLIGAALLYQSYARRYDADPGVDTRRALTAALTLAGEAYADPVRRAVFLEELVARLRALPDVEDAGIANGLPIPDALSGGWWARAFESEGRPVEREHVPRAVYFTATTGFLRAAGLRLTDGRLFSEEEELEGRDVVLVSDGLARRAWGEARALGRRLRIEGGPWLKVVGVVRESEETGDVLRTGAKPPGQIYVPYRRDPWRTVSLVVRTPSSPASLSGAVRAALRTLDPALPLHTVFTMDEVHARAFWVSRLWGRMLAVVAAIALLLAGLGVYGVVSYSVSQRTHEIGVRMAVGARRGAVLRLVLGQAVRLGLLAVAVGLTGAVLLSGALAGLLFGVDPLDLPTLVGAALFLLLTALAASYAPAWRATRVDPLVALRAE